MQYFKDILCVVVSGVDNEAVLECAAALAENNQACLTVVEVIEEMPAGLRHFDRSLFPDDFQAKRLAARQQWLQDLVAPWNSNIKIETRVLVGIAFLDIIRDVLRHGHDLVIKAAENGGLLDRLFGSGDMHLLRKCPCPVWLVKSKSSKAYQKILAAVDVDDYYPPAELSTRHELNLRILHMANSLAQSEFADLHVVHVWDAIGETLVNVVPNDTTETEIANYVEQVRQHNKINLDALIHEVSNHKGKDAPEYFQPQMHLIKGSPRKEVPAFAKKNQVDLVILGTVARSGIPGFLMGNTVETILHQLDCSILAIKPPGFVTPVTLEGSNT